MSCNRLAPTFSQTVTTENTVRNMYFVCLPDAQQPFFPEIVENVTVSFGRKAVLKCEVENLRNYKVVDPSQNKSISRIIRQMSHCETQYYYVVQVAWVRVDTQTILTIHNNVITRNPRISLSRPEGNKWSVLPTLHSAVLSWQVPSHELGPGVRPRLVHVPGKSQTEM